MAQIGPLCPPCWTKCPTFSEKMNLWHPLCIFQENHFFTFPFSVYIKACPIYQTLSVIFCIHCYPVIFHPVLACWHYQVRLDDQFLLKAVRMLLPKFTRFVRPLRWSTTTFTFCRRTFSTKLTLDV